MVWSWFGLGLVMVWSWARMDGAYVISFFFLAEMVGLGRRGGGVLGAGEGRVLGGENGGWEGGVEGGEVEGVCGVVLWYCGSVVVW